MSTWQYKLGDQQLGPVSFHELAELVRAGKVSEGTQVCRAGTMNWEPAWRVPGLFRAAGIVEEGDSPPVGKDQDGGVAQTALSPALSRRERGPFGARQPFLTTAMVVRGLIAAAVGVLAVGFFYRWSWQTTIAFPMPAKMVEGELIDCYFPLVGRCTRLECGLLYLDVFGVAALATWYAAPKQPTEK